MSDLVISEKIRFQYPCFITWDLAPISMLGGQGMHPGGCRHNILAADRGNEIFGCQVLSHVYTKPS